MTRYYTLLERDDKHSRWTPQFGDYSRATVMEERNDRLDSYHDNVKRSNTMVIVTGDKQEDITVEVNRINKELGL